LILLKLTRVAPLAATAGGCAGGRALGAAAWHGRVGGALCERAAGGGG